MYFFLYFKKIYFKEVQINIKFTNDNDDTSCADISAIEYVGDIFSKEITGYFLNVINKMSLIKNMTNF